MYGRPKRWTGDTANTTVASRVAVISARVLIAKDQWRCVVAAQLCPPAGSCVALLGISGHAQPRADVRVTTLARGSSAAKQGPLAVGWKGNAAAAQCCWALASKTCA